jgi:hypothetical protein
MALTATRGGGERHADSLANRAAVWLLDDLYPHVADNACCVAQLALS